MIWETSNIHRSKLWKTLRDKTVEQDNFEYTREVLIKCRANNQAEKNQDEKYYQDKALKEKE